MDLKVKVDMRSLVVLSSSGVMVVSKWSGVYLLGSDHGYIAAYIVRDIDLVRDPVHYHGVGP